MPTVHVIPVNDLIEHITKSTCICHPRIDIVEGGMIVIHDALDGRVVSEKAQEILDLCNSPKRVLDIDRPVM